MGKAERQRWSANGQVDELLRQAATRSLTAEELDGLRTSYTGAGGLVPVGWDRGQFFTPPVVTRFVVDLLGITGGDVLEPSCGGGAFLHPLPAACRVQAVDATATATRVAALLYPTAGVRCGDALEGWDELAGRFDFVVGNPPFVKLPKGWARAGFPETGGQPDAVWAFIELALRALRPDGYLAMVVSDGILTNSRDQKFRNWILHSHRLLAVLSLPVETFLHAGTTVKTSILVLRKRGPKTPPSTTTDQIFMGIVDDIGWNGRRRETGKCDIPELLDAWRDFVRDNHPELAAQITARIGIQANPQMAVVPFENKPPAPTPESESAVPLLPTGTDGQLGLFG